MGVAPIWSPALGARSSVVEHLTFNQRADGSIPSGLTILLQYLRAAEREQSLSVGLNRSRLGRLAYRRIALRTDVKKIGHRRVYVNAPLGEQRSDSIKAVNLRAAISLRLSF